MGHPDLFDDYFWIDKWSHMGNVLNKIAPSLNSGGDKLLSGSIIDFSLAPAQILSDDVLIMWLAVRGIINTFSDRNKLVENVKGLNNQNVLIFSKFLLRGGGG